VKPFIGCLVPSRPDRLLPPTICAISTAHSAKPRNAQISTVRIRASDGVSMRNRLPASLLAPALWSAADILVGLESARLRECANDRCLWLFFDDSKNGTRRWCSMQSCGNRAKAHRHYLRQKRQ
jgi:predicted RNA-binding Zn ribbon-like protein